MSNPDEDPLTITFPNPLPVPSAGPFPFILIEAPDDTIRKVVIVDLNGQMILTLDPTPYVPDP